MRKVMSSVRRDHLHFSSIAKGHNLPHSQLTSAYFPRNLAKSAPPYPRTHSYDAVQSNALQEVKNTIAITYPDQEDIERTVKLQIHGATTIPGEGVKAQEF